MERQKSTNSLFKGGSFFNIFQTGTPAKSGGGDSSDEEDVVADSLEFIRNGQKGIVVFNNVYCVKTNRIKTFHIHLYNGHVYQYIGDKRKKVLCGDIQQIVKRTDNNQLLVDIKRPRDLTTRQKKLLFDTDKDAMIYKRYIDFCNDVGLSVRHAFDTIDARRTHVISTSNLKKSLKEFDIEANEEDIRAM